MTGRDHSWRSQSNPRDRMESNRLFSELNLRDWGNWVRKSNAIVLTNKSWENFRWTFPSKTLLSNPPSPSHRDCNWLAYKPLLSLITAPLGCHLVQHPLPISAPTGTKLGCALGLDSRTCLYSTLSRARSPIGKSYPVFCAGKRVQFHFHFEVPSWYQM